MQILELLRAHFEKGIVPLLACTCFLRENPVCFCTCTGLTILDTNSKVTYKNKVHHSWVRLINQTFEMQLGSNCFRDAAAVIRTLKKSNEISPPSATRRRFNMNVWKLLARQRAASRICMVYTLWFYYILIPIWLPNAEVFACPPKIQSPSHLFPSPFLPAGSKRDGARMGMLCPGMGEGGWAPAPLGALTAPESSGAAGTSLSELSMA